MFQDYLKDKIVNHEFLIRLHGHELEKDNPSMEFKSAEDYEEMSQEERKDLTQKMKQQWLGEFGMNESQIGESASMKPKGK